MVCFRQAADILIINRFFLLLTKIRLESLIPIIETTIFIMQSLSRILRNHKKEVSRNSINIGIDPNGAIAALVKSYIFRQKIIYLDLELRNPKLMRGLSRFRNVLARLAFKRAECIIIQDNERYDTICGYYNYRHPRVFYLPNAPAPTQFFPNEGENYFREKFQLNNKDFPCLVVQAGWIAEEFTFSETLARSFLNINLGCAFIFHERHERGEDYDIVKLRNINSRNLFLSLNPVSFGQLDKVFSSITIGLAFYNEYNDTRALIAKASGKIPYYLKHGKPILVNNLKSLADLAECYKCGIVIKNPTDSNEIKYAIEEILANYVFYSKNARNCYEKEFNYEIKVKPILSFIDQL